MSESTDTRKKIIRNYINIAIVFGVMIIAHFIPAPAPITPLGVQILGIFVGLIYGWNTCGMLWPSLAGILMLGFTEYSASPEAALGTALTNTTVMTMLCTFIAFNFVSLSGLTNKVAVWLVTRKFTVGKPWVFLCFIFVAGSFVCGVFSSIVMIIVCFEFIIPLFKQMGYTKEDLFPTYSLLGVATILGVMTVWPAFLPHSIYTKGILTSALGTPLTTFQYTMCVSVPLVVMSVTYVLVGKFILKVDTRKFVEASYLLSEKMEASQGEKLTPDEKNGAIVLAFFILGMALPAILPTTWPIISQLNRLGVVGVSMLTVIAVIVLMKKDGSTLSDFNKLMRAMDWNMIMLTAAIMTIAAAVTSNGTGIIAWLNMVLLPILSNMSIVVFVIVVMVVLCIASQFSMNMVLQMVFAPILAPMLVAAGYNPMIAVLAVYLGTQMAFLAPSGSMMAAMVFAKTDWVKPSHIYKIVLTWLVVTMPLFIVISLTFPDLFCANLIP